MCTADTAGLRRDQVISWLSSQSISAAMLSNLQSYILKKLFQLRSGALERLCWWLQNCNLCYIVLMCYFKEGEMHTTALKNTLQRRENAPEVGEVLLGELLRTRGKHLKQWSPSCHFHGTTSTRSRG